MLPRESCTLPPYKMIRDKLVRLANLRVLCLRGCFGDDCVALLLADIAHMPHLAVIHLRDNEISNKGLLALIQGLAGMKCLEELNLGCDNVGTATLRAALDQWPELTDLSKCGLDDTSAAVLKKAAERMPTLKVIVEAEPSESDSSEDQDCLAESDFDDLQECNRCGDEFPLDPDYLGTNPLCEGCRSGRYGSMGFNGLFW